MACICLPENHIVAAITGSLACRYAQTWRCQINACDVAVR
jgi:hypothetical protein